MNKVKLGYLLPTREKVMVGQHGTAELLALARQAADLGFDSLWAGDSLLARPRHDPLTLLAAVAASTDKVQLGTAVLLPALRNPIILAQQLATIDQLSEGRLVVGAGIAADHPGIRHEFAAAGVPFEGRVGRLLEGFRLCRALWSGERVNWEGRWQVTDAQLGPEPFQKGGPPIWLGATVEAGIKRAAKHFDGWFPIGPDAKEFARRETLFRTTAEAAGRDVAALSTTLYVTIAVAESELLGDQAINAYLQDYYGAPAEMMRSIQACYGGPIEKVMEFLSGYVAAGAQHLVIRVVGDHPSTLRALAGARGQIDLAT